jgi:hypothetical protein
VDKNQELRNRIPAPEDSFVERKLEGAGRSVWRRAIVAFANSVPENQTGVLFIGVRDGGEAAGVKDPDALQKTITEICTHDCYPPVTSYTCAVLPMPDRVLGHSAVSIVAVEVSLSKDRPHFSGPAYVRKGSQTVAASREMFEDLTASRHDKARVILRWKQEHTIITVELIGTKLENLNLGAAGYHASITSVVQECTSHGVTFSYAHGHYHVPFESVQIDEDLTNHRPKLVVRPPK